MTPPRFQTYLVTGAAGFIASKVCEQLLAAGHTVVGIDNLNDYYDVRLKDYRLGQLLGDERWRGNRDPRRSAYLGGSEFRKGSFTFRPLDIENLPALEELFREFRFDAVFNLAGRAGVRASLDNPYIYLSTNTLGTLNVLECMRRQGVGKLVLASSSSLYAGCPMPFREDQPVNTPVSPYAATKKAAELLAHSYHKVHGLDVTVLRYFTVFGPAGRPDMAPLRFVKWIAEGTPIELFGDGTQARDFTYVDDIARGTILAAKPLGYEIINLGGGRRPVSLQTMIAMIETAFSAGGQKATDGGPLKARIAAREAHAADVQETWADIAKGERLLGWKPEVSPEDGFQRTVGWYLVDRGWLKDIKL